jgi:hypothetical protein
MPARKRLRDHVSYDFMLAGEGNCRRKAKQDKAIRENLVSYDFTLNLFCIRL